MKICREHGNGVLVYDHNDCPACEEISDLMMEVTELRGKRRELLKRLEE